MLLKGIIQCILQVFGVAILKSALTYKPLRRTNKTYKNSTMRSHNAPHARSLIHSLHGIYILAYAVRAETLFRSVIVQCRYERLRECEILSVKDVVWDIFVFDLGNTPGFHLIRAKVCSVFKLKFALNIPYCVYLFL